MNDINRVLLLGRLGQDPILRETKSGIKVASFSLATDIFLKTKNEKETSWHKIVAWGRAAEFVAQELKKGMPVFIEGKIKTRKYENENGETRTSVEVHADHVRFLHRRYHVKSSPLETEAETRLHGHQEQQEESLSIHAD